MMVEIAGIRLRNPVLAASGTFGYGLEWAPLLDLNSIAGFVTKGLSREPMPGNPPPRLAVMPTEAGRKIGMLNSIGLQNVGVAAFVREKLPKLAKFKTAVIANVFGYEIEDYVAVVRQLDAAHGIAAYELNLSCPNTSHGGMTFGIDPQLTSAVVGAVKKIATRPVFAKLSPNVNDIVPIATAAQQAGADALSLVNTVVAKQSADVPASARIPSGGGGLSGPAIHSIAVQMVKAVRSAVKIPIIGLGGVICGADAAEFIRAGATAVQVGTANFYDPLAVPRIARELEAYCRQAGLSSVRDLR
jgi:dihydroorotate dehydrogenase (NAD+) catalytic subunit